MATIKKDKLRSNDVPIGDGTDSNKKLSFDKGQATNPYLKYDTVTGKLVYSSTGLQADEVDLTNIDVAYVHNQSTPASVWTISHGLGKYPSVVVVDSSGRVVDTQIEYIDENNVKSTSEVGAFSGKAYLN